MNYQTQRRNNLVRDLKADGLDALLVTHPANIRYLGGFTGSSAALLVMPKQTMLLSDARYQEQIKEEVTGLEIVIRHHAMQQPEATAELLAKSGAKSIGYEVEHTTVADFETFKAKAPKVELVPAKGKVEKFRALKDASEVESIRAAVVVAEKAFRMFLAMITADDTERELANSLDYYMRKAGAQGLAFPPIVAIGERGALPHAPPSARAMTDGSKVLVDWGADLGYKSDITRTMKSPYPTPPTRKSKQERVGFDFDRVYAAVKAAHLAAVAALKPGIEVKEVDAIARKALTKHSPRYTDLAEYFTHNLGHGLGLETHEAPFFRPNSDVKLEAGNVVTIEPGVYMPGWGGVRLEDDYLVTKDGAIRLTTLPHDPDAIV